MIYWIILFLYSLSLPFTRPILKISKNYILPANLALILFAIGIILFLIFLLKKKETRISVYLFLIVLVTLTYFFIKSEGIKYPVEKIHIVQYTILCFLSFIAMSQVLENISIYFWSILLCTLIGVGDEVLQGIIPERYFDYKDIILNFKIVILGHLYIFLVLRLHDKFTKVLKLKINKLLILSLIINIIYIIFSIIVFVEGKSVDWKIGGYIHFTFNFLIIGILCFLLNLFFCFEKILCLKCKCFSNLIDYQIHKKNENTIYKIISIVSNVIIIFIISGKIFNIPFG